METAAAAEPDAYKPAEMGYAGLTLDESLPATAAPAQPAARRRATALPVDDVTLALSVADALVQAKIGGVKILAAQGRITLTGMVDDAAAVKRALEATQGVPGVREIENRLVSAEIFELD